jgi:hypothetical protein
LDAKNPLLLYIYVLPSPYFTAKSRLLQAPLEKKSGASKASAGAQKALDKFSKLVQDRLKECPLDQRSPARTSDPGHSFDTWISQSRDRGLIWVITGN